MGACKDDALFAFACERHGGCAANSFVIPAHAGIQYTQSRVFITAAGVYWIARFRGR